MQEMTIGEIESSFDSEWVLVGDPVTDEALNVLRGKVLHHSKDRDEVYRRGLNCAPNGWPSSIWANHPRERPSSYEPRVVDFRRSLVSLQ